jgi:hypothetical protein
MTIFSKRNTIDLSRGTGILINELRNFSCLKFHSFNCFG